MPLLQINLTSSSVAQDILDQIHHQGAEILAEQLGKSIEYVMVLLRTDQSISFSQDKKTPSAYIEVKNVGKMDQKITQSLTSKLTNLVTEKLGVPAKRTYIEFQ